MDSLLQKSIDMAYIGREHWLWITEKYELTENSLVVLFPDKENEINDIAWQCIERISDKKDKIIVLTENENISEIKNVNQVLITRQYAEELMKFYSLYQFTDKLIIVSLDEPEGRHGKGLVGKKGITLEDMVNIGIFGLKD